MREACRQLAANLLSRRTQDRVATLGSGVDGAVRRIETAYNKRGDVERITSFDSASSGSGNVVNEVFVLYNGFGQAIETYQSHAGAVNLSTTPSVQMAYADGSANSIRPTGITYDDWGRSGLQPVVHQQARNALKVLCVVRHQRQAMSQGDGGYHQVSCVYGNTSLKQGSSHLPKCLGASPVKIQYHDVRQPFVFNLLIIDWTPLDAWGERGARPS